MRPIINLRRQTSSSFMILTFPLGPCGPLAPLAPLGDREKARTGNTSRERLPPRPSPPEPQLMPGAMSDGDDHQPPQDDRQRERSRSRDRVHPHAQVPQVQIQFPRLHQLDHHHQLNREVAPEETKDPDRVSGYFHIHLRIPASSHNLLYLLRELSKPRLWQLGAQMKLQQPWIHKIAVSDRSRSSQEQESSRRQGLKI